MRLHVDSPAAVGEQMAIDRAAFERAMRVGLAGPVLRLFRFEPAGITLGASQVAEMELDLARCTEDGVAWAHRPTGGRAIFHGEEWTFSLLARLGDGGWAADARAAYQRTNALIGRALVRLGAPVALDEGSAKGVGAPRSRGGAAPPCFATSARHELTLGGRKCAGIAQRVGRCHVLQQGSLLIGPGHERLADYAAGPPERQDELRESMRHSSVEMGPWIGDGRTLDDLAEAIEACSEGPVRRTQAASVRLPH